MSSTPDTRLSHIWHIAPLRALGHREGHRVLLAAARRVTYADTLVERAEGPMLELSFGDDGYTLGNASVEHIIPVWRRCDQKTKKPLEPPGIMCIASAYEGCKLACVLCRGFGLKANG